MPCKYMGNMQIPSEIQIDSLQLTSFFELQSFNGLLQNMDLTFIIQDEKLTHFGSGTCNMEELTELFNTVPNELPPLKSQLIKLLKAIEQFVLDKTKAVAEEPAYAQRYLQQIASSKTTEILRRNAFQPRAAATEAEVQQAEVILEKSFLVKDIPHNKNVYLGTSGIASCLALIIYNSVNQRVGLAHLDELTIETYRESLTNMFDACGGSSVNQNEIYIVGLEHLFSYPITMDIAWARMLDTAINHSRSLALSLYEFIGLRADSILKGVVYSDSFKSGNVLVSASKDGCEIFTADSSFSYILSRNFEKNTKLIGFPCDYTQLVNLKTCRILQSAAPTPNVSMEVVAAAAAEELDSSATAASAFFSYSGIANWGHCSCM